MSVWFSLLKLKCFQICSNKLYCWCNTSWGYSNHGELSEPHIILRQLSLGEKKNLQSSNLFFYCVQHCLFHWASPNTGVLRVFELSAVAAWQTFNVAKRTEQTTINSAPNRTRPFAYPAFEPLCIVRDDKWVIYLMQWGVLKDTAPQFFPA